MTWTYNPVERDLDKVRLEIGDTDKNEPLLQDEEITFVLSLKGNVLAASAMCCEIIARILSRKADENVGDLSIRYKADEYANRAKELMRKVAAIGMPVVETPIPIFKLGMHDAVPTQSAVE